jgi:hypothetical protein
MTGEENFVPEESTPWFDPEVISVVDWCVLSGGELLTKPDDRFNPFGISLLGVELYVGIPTCEDRMEVYKDEKYFFPHHVVEVAALVGLGTSLPRKLLRQFVKPIQQRIAETVDGHHIEVEVADMGEDYASGWFAGSLQRNWRVRSSML